MTFSLQRYVKKMKMSISLSIINTLQTGYTFKVFTHKSKGLLKETSAQSLSNIALCLKFENSFETSNTVCKGKGPKINRFALDLRNCSYLANANGFAARWVGFNGEAKLRLFLIFGRIDCRQRSMSPYAMNCAEVSKKCDLS